MIDALATKIEPQQGMPLMAARRPSVRREPDRAVSQQGLEDYLNLWQRHIANEQKKNDKLCEMSVTIHRRARALTLSDMCGRFGVRNETVGHWLDYDADLDGEIHPINVVGPALNANQNACLQSNSETEVSSANQNAQNKQNAMRWQRVADYFERTGWDEAERAFIFDAVQKDGTILVYSYKEKVDTQTAGEVREKKMGLAVYQCQCGSQGLSETEDLEEGMQDMPCPECGQPAPAMVKAISSYELDESEVPTYKIRSDVIPFFNFTIDSYGAKIKGIDGARFLQIQRLVDRVDIETKYGDKVFAGPGDWSYQLKCDYALANGSWNHLNRFGHGTGIREFHKFEERSIYLHADAYSNYVAPEDYKFTNSQGKTTLKIARGQKIEEAWEAQYGFRPSGFKFTWIDQRLVDIASPVDETLNFRDCFSDVHWRRDSGSYLSSPNHSIVTIQDDITLLNTMNHNIAARNSVNQVVFDSLVYEESDFTKEYIGTKNAHMLGENRDMSKSIFQLPVPTPTPHLSAQLQFLWSVKDDVTSVTPAMRGEAQKGETFGAQRQQLEQSYGGLSSVLKSFAQCKNTVFKQKARICKEHWTVEQFQSIGSMFGELWNEQDVADMCEVDLDDDLLINYKTGSEMPQSNISREMKFFQGIEQLMAFGPEVIFPMLGPEKITKILQKIDEMAGFDFDLTGLETNELIAQKRYLELAKMCVSVGPVSFEQVETAKQTPAAIDEMGMPITQLDVITEQIFAQSQIRFSQYEDLEQQKAFFIEQLRAETGKTSPNYLLLEMMHVVIGFIDQAVAEAAQAAMMADPAVQAQIAADAATKEDADASAAREDENANADREMKAKELEAKGQSEESAQVLGMLQDAAGQEHEIEKIKLAAELAPKDEGKPKK